MDFSCQNRVFSGEDDDENEGGNKNQIVVNKIKGSGGEGRLVVEERQDEQIWSSGAGKFKQTDQNS